MTRHEWLMRSKCRLAAEMRAKEAARRRPIAMKPTHQISRVPLKDLNKDQRKVYTKMRSYGCSREEALIASLCVFEGW